MSTQPRPAWFNMPILMLAVGVLFVLFQFTLQLSSGVLIRHLTESFHTTALGAGLLASSFYIAYVVLQTPAGMLIDRYGVRTLLTLGAVVCGAGCWLFSSTSQLLLGEFGRLMMGGGAAFAFVATVRIIAVWFPPQYFALLFGLIDTVALCGTLAGNMLIATTIAYTSWRVMMTYAAVFALILSVLCWVVIRDRPQQANAVISWAEFLKEVGLVIRHRGLWANGLYSGLMFSIITVFTAMWGIPYFVLAHNISETLSTFICSLSLVGTAIGAPLMGLLYIHVDKKCHFLALCSLLCGIITAVLIYSPWHCVTFDVTLLILLGAISSCYVFNFTIAKELVPTNICSTAIGFTNTLCVLPAPLLQPLVGAILWQSSEWLHPETPLIHTVTDYHWALLVLPVILVLGALLAYAIPQSRQAVIPAD